MKAPYSGGRRSNGKNERHALFSPLQQPCHSGQRHLLAYGYEFAELYDINRPGTFSFKGTTRDARLGNPQPRIAEMQSGMLNAVGLQNPGVDAVIAEELPKLARVIHKPVMANVSGFSLEEYVEVCQTRRLPAGRLARGEHLLPQRPRRRHELRH